MKRNPKYIGKNSFYLEERKKIKERFSDKKTKREKFK